MVGYYIAILAAGDEPIALTAADREQVRALYPDAALVAPTTREEIFAAGWDAEGIEDCEASLREEFDCMAREIAEGS